MILKVMVTGGDGIPQKSVTMKLTSSVPTARAVFTVIAPEILTKKNNKIVCAPSKDSDQPGHPTSLISVFAVGMKKAWDLSYLLSASEDADQTGRMPRPI